MRAHTTILMPQELPAGANLLFSDRPYCMKQLKEELKTNVTAGLISLCTLQFFKERVMQYPESYKEEAERMNERLRKYIFPNIKKKVAAEKEKWNSIDTNSTCTGKECVYCKFDDVDTDVD